MKINDWNCLVLSTGKKIKESSILGIDHEGLGIYVGYHNGINPADYTQDELIELADFAISRWERFKKQIKGG